MDRIIKREVETGCEYTLPDYMGDIKRVLFSSASAIPTGKFVSDGGLELSGLVNFDVVYSDSEGKLTAFSASADLDIKEPIDTACEVDAEMSARPSAISVRVVGPRRVALRSSFSVSTTISGESALGIEGDVFGDNDGDTVETMSAGINALCSRFHASGEREYAEEACRLVGVTSEDVEIIATSGRVTVTEAISEDGGIRVKGEMVITSLVRTEEQPPFAVKKIIPFDERIEIDGVMPTDSVFANAYLTSETMGIAEDGDATVLSANAICEFTLMISENKEIEVTKDAYLIDRECKNTYERLNYLEHVATVRMADDFSEKVSREEIGLSSAREIILINADSRVDEKVISGDSIEISGICRVNGVACEISPSGQPTYVPFRTDVPFALSGGCGCLIPSEAEFECALSVRNLECTFESDNLCVSMTVLGDARIVCPRSIERLASCMVASEEKIDTFPSKIVVYYPDEDETLYDVSKLHHVRMADVARKNGISVETVSREGNPPLRAIGVKHIMLP